jgi:adenylate kinase family enzyme
MVLLFECPREMAEARFLQRSREVGDNETMFEKRYAEYEHNNQLILDRYRDLVERVSQSW